ncbi:hypothetical protein BDZ91DRAFT_733602 [Kalaharituber pfeilii]|nr:hypothetical protein BDZ91DRAFT_733602 [Kalaharituber pfeilii]
MFSLTSSTDINLSFTVTVPPNTGLTVTNTSTNVTSGNHVTLSFDPAPAKEQYQSSQVGASAKSILKSTSPVEHKTSTETIEGLDLSEVRAISAAPYVILRRWKAKNGAITIRIFSAHFTTVPTWALENIDEVFCVQAVSTELNFIEQSQRVLRGETGFRWDLAGLYHKVNDEKTRVLIVVLKRDE